MLILPYQNENLWRGLIFVPRTLIFQSIGNTSKVEELTILPPKLFTDFPVVISIFGHQDNFARGTALKLSPVKKFLSLNVRKGSENIGAGYLAL
jgi:hypothetical protein